MRFKKQIIIVGMIVFAFIILGWAMIMKKPTKDIVIEEDVADLPQKPSVSLDTYMPIVKDMVWTYEDSNMRYKPIISWVDFIKSNVVQIRFKQDGQVTAKVFVEEEEAIYEVATVKDATIKQDYTTLRQYNKIVMKLPLEVGSSWVLADGAIRTITGVDKEYDTPLGKQKGIEVTTNHTDYSQVETFVEKIGLYSINYESKEKAGKITLSKTENNKPQEEDVTLYLFNKATKEMEKIDEKVAVMTNEEPKHFLTDLLKKAPNENYLTTISNGAIINNIFLDEEESSLYVEMSADFIEQTYDKVNQQHTIMSLVNTLGHYYNATYVVITVEGEAYPLKSPLKDNSGRIKVQY